jgi:hypothetical protein
MTGGQVCIRCESQERRGQAQPPSMLSASNSRPVLPTFWSCNPHPIDTLSFGEVFTRDLRQLLEKDNPAFRGMPLGSFLLLTVPRAGLGGSKAKGTNGTSILQKVLSGSSAIHLKMTSGAWISAINVAFF